jgi:hypothetical protein
MHMHLVLIGIFTPFISKVLGAEALNPPRYCFIGQDVPRIDYLRHGFEH